MPSTVATESRTRIGIAASVLVTCVGMIVYAYYKSVKLQYLSESQDEAKVQTSAPSMLRLVEYGDCDSRCTTAASLIRQVEDRARTVTDGRLTNVSRRELRAFWKLLEMHRDTLRDPITKQYVFVDERIPNKKGGYRFVTRAHADPDQINVPLAEAQKSVDKFCKSKKCNLQEIIELPFRETNVTDRRYLLMDYPWYDPINQRESVKRSIIYRLSDNVVVGSGFTLTKRLVKPNVELIAQCVTVYALFLVYVFAVPGIFYTHGITLLTCPHHPGVARNRGVVISFVVLTLCITAMHASSIKSNDGTTNKILRRKLTNQRYFAILLASLALALGFFASYQRKYEHDILPALLISFLFSLLALLDLYGGNDNNTYTTKLQLTRTFITCSILTLLWLFTCLTIQWQIRSN